jgi:hypothetical protein
MEKVYQLNHLGTNGSFIFRVPLECEVQYRLLVFVFQESKNGERRARAGAGCFLRHVFEMYGDPHTGLWDVVSSRLSRRADHDTSTPDPSSAFLNTPLSVRLKSSNWNIRA